MKTALITGAAGGIGNALAERLVKDYQLLLVVRNNRQAKSINLETSKISVCDLSNIAELKILISWIKKQTDTLDLLVNVAGVANYLNLNEITNDIWQESMAVNITAPFILIRDLLPIMSIDSLVLNIGSGAGSIPMRGRSAYCASKFALRGLTLSLAEEFKDQYPSFCLITLGSTITNFGPLSAEEKQVEADSGKAYFPVEWVADKLVQIIADKNRDTEIVLYPGEHGFGEWKKP
jgi:short-subunit dehydrogenase